MIKIRGEGSLVGGLIELVVGRRSGRTALSSLVLVLVLMVGSGLVLWKHAPEDAGIGGDGHPSISLELAFNWVFCGQPASLSEAHRIAGYLHSHAELVRTPLDQVAIRQAGTIGAYCRSLTIPYLNGENSLMVATAAILAVRRDSSLASLEWALCGSAAVIALLFAFVLFRAGSGLPLVAVMLAAYWMIILDLEGLRYSQYTLILPAIVLNISVFAMALSFRLWSRLWTHTLTLVAAGFLVAFTANIRTSCLPACVLFVVCYCMAAAWAKTTESPAAARSHRIRTLTSLTVVSVIAFAAGYSVFQFGVIKRLTPSVTTGNYTYHPIAHPLVLGLAVPMNDLARREHIEWNDGAGLELAQRAIPEATYLGPLYEKALFSYYRSLWRNHPKEMLRLYIVKFSLAGVSLLEWSNRGEYGGGVYGTVLVALRGLPSGLLVICLCASVIVYSAWRWMYAQTLSAFVLMLVSVAALLVQLEASIIMPEFYMQYQSVLMFGLLFLCMSAYEAAARNLPVVERWAHECQLELGRSAAVGGATAGLLYVAGRHAARQSNVAATWIDGPAIAAAVLYGCVGLGLYLLFRFATGRALAVLGTAAVVLSSARFLNNPSLPDLAGVALTLGALVAMSWMVVRERPTALMLRMVVVLGLLLGLGKGLHTSPLLPAPLVALSLVAFAQFSRRTGIRTRVIAAAVLITVTTVVAWPTGSANLEPRRTWSSVVDQFSSANDGRLRLRRNPFSFDPLSVNGSRAALRDVFDRAEPPGTWTVNRPDRNGLGERDVLDLVASFPADFLARSYAAVAANMFNARTDGDIVERLLRPDVPSPIRTATGRLYAVVTIAALVSVGMIVVGAGAASFRLGGWLLLVLVYLTATAGMEISDTLSVALVKWWAITAGSAMVARAVFAGATKPRGIPGPEHLRRRGLRLAARRGAVFAVAASFIFAIALLTARAYQTRRLHAVIRSLSENPPDAWAKRGHVEVQGRVARVLLDRSGGDAGATGFLAGKFGSANCDLMAVPVKVSWPANSGLAGVARSQDINVRVPKGLMQSTELFVPVYASMMVETGDADDAPRGAVDVELPASGAECLAGMRLVGRNPRTSLAYVLQVPDGWQDVPAYDTFARWERGDAEERIMTSPAGIAVSRQLVSLPVEPLSATTALIDTSVQQRGSRLFVHGEPPGRFSYLYVTNPAIIGRNRYLLAEGTVRKGGMTIGLLKGNAWSRAVNVTVPGGFLALIRVDDDAEYSVVVANDSPPETYAVVAQLDRIGIMATDQTSAERRLKR